MMPPMSVAVGEDDTVRSRGRAGRAGSWAAGLLLVSASCLPPLDATYQGTDSFGAGGTTSDSAGSLDELSGSEGTSSGSTGMDVTETSVASQTGTGDLDNVELHPSLVVLAGATFVMGSPTTETDRGSDEVEHMAQVSPFEMCETEVTQAHWEAVMGANPSDCDYGCGPDHPVQNVSWEDIVEFMNRLTDAVNAQRGDTLTPCYEGTVGGAWTWNRTCTGFRLPTEAEWEYAARADAITAYTFGDNPTALRDYAWYSDNSGDTAHAVREKFPNGFGLYDMHGNVWEWVYDWYEIYPTELTPNYEGPTRGDDRGLRGGSFVSGTGDLRSAVRGWRPPGERTGGDGFRCARGSTPI